MEWILEICAAGCVGIYLTVWCLARKHKHPVKSYALEECEIVGLSGKRGSGKSTAATLLAQIGAKVDRPVLEIAYGDTLKHACAHVLCVPLETFHTKEGKSRVDPFYGLTYGALLQRMGTDVLRQHFHPQVWLVAAERRARLAVKDGGPYSAKPIVVFSDVRFVNEADRLKEWGATLVRIERAGSAEAMTCDGRNADHSSETELDDYPMDVFLSNDATVPQLAEALESALFCRSFRRNNHHIKEVC